ncbi:MAG: methyltransferase domain-containing protein [Pseudomonadota bacterium]
MPIDPNQLTRRRCDRLAPWLDLIEMPAERLRLSTWRNRLREHLIGPRALEVGVGTGKNFAFYPPGAKVTAIDLSPRMLAQARAKAELTDVPVTLSEMDAQTVDFPDNSFDSVFATFVFCSVPDPIKGLKELRRVCRPGGRLLLLEHVRPTGCLLGWLFDLLNPLMVRLSGANLNRRTKENLIRAGWELVTAENLAWGVVWWLEAQPGQKNARSQTAPSAEDGERD